MLSRTVLGSAVAVALVGAMAATACGGGTGEKAAPSATTSAPAAEPAAAPVDEATAATVTGKVVLEGAPGKNDPIRMNADPVCVRENKGTQLQETFVVGDGGSLGNVFVYVKDGLGSRTFTAPSAPVTLDQKACRYHPHVFGVQAGQQIEIINSDPTLHNIHAVPKSNSEFNTAQPIQNMKTSHTFEEPEVMVPFKCDVHGWMNAYAGVVSHPYFAVTGTDGTFTLKTLPPGTYTVEAWHERLGAQTQSVTVGAKESKELNFTFKSAAATD
jgi:plastocyanin